MLVPLSEQSYKTLENDIKFYQIQCLIDQLHVSTDNREFGVTSHERLHLIETIKVYKDRTAEILSKLHPAKEIS